MMLNYKEWQIINESLNGMNLGLKTPANLGVTGSKFEEGLFEDDDEEKDDLEDETDDEAEDDGEEPNPDFVDNPQGPENSFPPDDSEEMDGLPTPDQEMLGGDEMMGDEMGGESPFGADGMGGDPAAMGHDDFAAALAQHLGSAPEAPEGDADMSFLNDIDPAMMGDEMGGDEMMGGEIPPMAAGEEGLGGEEDLEGLDGEEGGEGDFAFDLDPEGEEGLEEEDPANCTKYMNMKFMSKGAKKETCDPLAASLKSMAQGMPRTKNKSGITEDALLTALDPNYDAQVQQPSAGEVGFAPQGRVGAIGGGYTQDDIKSIPVLGESRKYPTLAEYIAKKEASKKS